MEQPNPAMAADLGDIPPGSSSVVVWRIEAQEPGKFIEFSSDYRMNNYTGDSLAPILRAINTFLTPNGGVVCQPSGGGGSTYSISGVVTQDGQSLSGVRVSGNGTYVTTDASGSYTLNDLLTGTYTIVPAANGVIFAPTKQTVEVPPDANGVDFAGTAGNTYTLTGRVAVNGTTPLEGVTIRTDYGVNAVTDVNGNYILFGVPGGTYTAYPVKDGYEFSPRQQTRILPPNANGVDFDGKENPRQGTHSIAGCISGAGGAAVTVSASNGALTTSDSNGCYRLTGLPEGTHIVRPSAGGLIFTPKSRNVTTPPDAQNVDFSASTGTTYNISGRVTDQGGAGIAGATIFSSAGVNALSDANGDYTLVGLESGSYTVYPSHLDYTFSPVQQPVSLPVNGGDATGIDFAGSDNGGGSGGTYNISGFAFDEAGNPLSGVNVSAGAGSATTNSAGFYLITGLSSGPYAITPSKADYAFTPASRNDSLPPSLPGLNFVGRAGTTYSVSGQVLDEVGNPMADVLISSSFGTNTTTDGNGNYTLTGLPAGAYYNFVPKKADYTFLPTVHTLLLNGDRTGIDFTGSFNDQIDIRLFNPSQGEALTVREPLIITAKVSADENDYEVDVVEVTITYLQEIDPESGAPRQQRFALEFTDVANGWAGYEDDWRPLYTGDVYIEAAMTVIETATNDVLQDSDAINIDVISAPCLVRDQLSPIGEAMAQVVGPATGYCGSSFEEIVAIPHLWDFANKTELDETEIFTDGTYTFQKMADLAQNASYEVLFANMTWDSFEDDGTGAATDEGAADIFLDGIEALYDNVLDKPEKYPKGMTVRILMGIPETYGLLGLSHPYPKELILEELVGRRGIESEVWYNGSVIWRLEVADYKYRYNHHSHVKVMIVDGETVIAGGYNVSDVYFPDIEGKPVEYDMGIELSGEIAQNALNMFDNKLWKNSRLCVFYSETTDTCIEDDLSDNTIDHVPEVLNPPVGGQGINSFSLFRNLFDATAEDAIFEAMAASTDSINLIQARLVYLFSIFDVPPKYVEGILEALDNGSTVRYVFSSQFENALVNRISYVNIVDAAKLRDLPLEIYAREGPDIHTKALSIDEETVIVGSLNFDLSSWRTANLIPNPMHLAEYDLAVDKADVAAQYNAYFEQVWASAAPIHKAEPNSQNPTETVIQELVDQAEPNAIIVLPAGLYQESVVVDKPLQITGVSGQETIIEPPGGASAFQVTSSDVFIYNLTVRGSAGYGIELIDSSPSSLENIFIRKVFFDNNALGGIMAQGLIPGSPINCVIENNTFLGGLYGVRNNVLEQQTITSTLRNNLFFGQSVVPIKIDGSHDGGVEYKYNLFNNCARSVDGVCPTDWYSGTLSSNSGAHNNLLNLDPGFNNPSQGDYALSLSSPIVNVGDPNTVNEMGLDGHIPLQADIGAFETELMLEPADAPFEETEGQIVMEAEHFTWNTPYGPRVWSTQTALAGYTGSGYLNAVPDTGLLFEDPYTQSNSGLSYSINLTTTGAYTLWLRGYAPDGAGDSLYFALEGQDSISTTIHTLTGFVPIRWSWAKTGIFGVPATVEVTEPGWYTLHLWMREDGLRLDRIILTPDSSYSPSGDGPNESRQISASN